MSKKSQFKHLLFIVGLSCPFLLLAQTEAERAKIRSEYNIEAVEALMAKFQKAKKERDERIAHYLEQNKAESTFQNDNVVYHLYDIAPNGTPIYINTKNVGSGQVINAHKLYNGGSLGLNIQGQSMVAGVWDGGPVRATHELLSGQATQIDGSTMNNVAGQNHMAHVTGTMVGKALSNGNTLAESARGIAFNATARCYDWDNDLSEMTAFANAGYLISNHSYGYANDNTTPVWQLGAYDNSARNWDLTVKTLPNYLPFVAGGNEQTTSPNAAAKGGYDVISGSSASKNVMTVGAVNGDLSMSDYSNWGPTDDGRFKPDIVAKGTGINSAQATSDNAYSGNGVESSGTSYATPAVAALALLLQQYHNSVKGSYLDAAGIKGLLLHTATDLGQTGPDYKFGWGLANGERAAQTIAASDANLTSNNSTAKIAKITTNPALGGSVTYTLKAKGGTPLSASICWVDDEGTEQVEANGIDPTTARLVYNFDIKLVDQVTNQEFFPWKGPGMANRTQNATRTGANDVDNFKRVDVDAPTAGRDYQLVITKRNTSPSDTRSFTIIWTGLEGAALPVELKDFSVKAQGKNGAVLSWTTASERGNQGFDVEISSDTEGSGFRKLGFVKGKGTSAIEQNYQFTTNDLTAGIHYFRLKQMDNDGKISYSSVKSLEIKDGVGAILYPNPAKDFVNIDINLAASADVTVTLFNQLGQVSQVILPKQHLEAGKYNFAVPTTNLASGLYFYQLNVNGTLSQGEIVINK